MAQGFRHRVHEGLCSIVDVLVLPIRERIGQNELDAAVDDAIHRSVSPAIPAIGRSDQGVGEGLVHIVDPCNQIGFGVCATIDPFGSNSHAIYSVAILLQVCINQCLLLLLVRATIRPERVSV